MNMTVKKNREYTKGKNKKSEVVNIRLSEEYKRKLLELGLKNNLNQSETIRMAINKMFEADCENI